MNSLGENALHMISTGPLSQDLTQIYLVDAADSAGCRDAVSHYLLLHGWKPDQFALVASPNPTPFPARPKIDDLDKLNNAAPAHRQRYER